MSMTPRQRWQAILTGQRPDRIITDYQSTPEFDAKLIARLGVQNITQAKDQLKIDYRRPFGAKSRRKQNPFDLDADVWGVRYEKVNYGTGSYSEAVHHPLASAQSVRDIHAHHWPNPDDYDYSSVVDALAKDDGRHPRLAGIYEPFLLYCYMRGLEQSFEDLVVNPEIADAILGHIFDFYYEYNSRLFKAAGKGAFDLFYLAEDLGSQTSPLISLETYRRFLRPGQMKMADLVRAYDMHIMYHTDGNARLFLPDLIHQVGIEMLNPVQWRCDEMDREGLVRDFGKYIIFHGAMDNQQTLPFGTVQDVIQETRDNLRIFGASPRGWICAPCHNIQPVTPPENILAMYETIQQIGAL